MKRLTYSLTLLITLFSLVASAQTSVPVVPEQLTFADISVRLDPDARRLVQQDVNALLANRQYWVAKLDRVVLYFPMIEAILIDEDVPTDFKYLAVQESSLTPDAVSSSAAVGYWQFKQETALGHGLRVDNEIDEIPEEE
jgi:membrane-bound lytic murein transglycosylase D